MRKEEVEIYSDSSNVAVIRHPGRRYPRSLVQGDSLQALCSSADEAIRALDARDLEEARDCMVEVRDILLGRLAHYNEVLGKYGMALLFR